MFICVTCMCQVLRYILLILLKKFLLYYNFKNWGRHASMKFHKCDLPRGHFHPGPCFLCSFHTAKKNLVKDKLDSIFLQISSVASVFPSPGGLTAGFFSPTSCADCLGSLDLRQRSHFSSSIQLYM